MAILQKLDDLGFTNCQQVKETAGVSTVRVRTDRGWVYEKFSSAAQVESWVNFHRPEGE